MIRVILVCDGIPADEGEQAAREIAKEFNGVRTPRYVNATCTFLDGILVLSCENDGWDADGLNLMDEFSDCLCAFIVTPTDRNLRLVSATPL
jgi:hypothetical protein